MKDIFNQWLDLVNLNPIERDILTNCKRDDESICDNSNFNDRINSLKQQLGGIDAKFKHNLCLSQCATNLIKGLFDNLYDDKTIVISTMQEHVNVLNILKDKNVHYVDFEINTYSEIINDCCNIDDIINKKIIIYISGTQVKTGTIIQNIFFCNLLENLHIRGCTNIITVLDDVQGMFILDRDYTLYDYIIGTAHSLCPYYDSGFLIQNRLDFNFGDTNSLWLEGYLQRLKIILSRKHLLKQFFNVCYDHFNCLFKQYGIKVYDKYVYGNIFAFNLGNVSFSDNEGKSLFNKRIFLHTPIDITNKHSGSSIKIRAQEFMRFSECIDKGVPYLELLLNMKI